MRFSNITYKIPARTKRIRCTKRTVRALRALALSLLALVPLASHAQESSINTFSPYTMYGIGNINFTGSTPFAAMGGTSLGWRNSLTDLSFDIRINTTNPASLSGFAGGRSLVLDVGLNGGGTYLRQKTNGRTLNSSFNSFNLNNITVAFPIARRLGFAVNVSPYSQIGYRIQEDDTSNLADIGLVRYYYGGEGDMTELKAGLGWEPTKGLSIGAEFIYLWGNVNRTYQAAIYEYANTGSYSELSARSGATAVTNEKISHVTAGFGLQISPIDKNKNRLTIGLTYRLGSRLRSTVTDYIPSNNIYGDTIRFKESRSKLYMPHTVGIGINYHRPKFAIGFDYIFQNWGKNGYDAVNDVRYINTHTYKAGLQFTPNRRDLGVKASGFFNRVTYRAGFRYNDYYMAFHGRRLSEKAVTIGFDIPFSAMKVTGMSLGFELGERGTLRQSLIRERYFKINVGFMLFGRDYDYWFEKYKYN